MSLTVCFLQFFTTVCDSRFFTWYVSWCVFIFRFYSCTCVWLLWVVYWRCWCWWLLAFL